MAVEFASMPFFTEMGEFFLTFLLLFAAIYGILTKTRFVSERNDVNAVIAFAFGMTVALSGVVPFIIKLMPFYMLMFLIIFVIFLLGKFVGMNMENVMKSKYVVIAIAGIFLTITAVIGWQEYSADINMQMALLNQTNMTNESGVNLTGNIFVDTVHTYNYQCASSNAYVKSLAGPNFLCILMHPRVLSTLIVLLTMAIVTGVIMYTSKKS